MQFLYLARRSFVAMWRSRLIVTQYVLVVACALLLGTLFFDLSLSTTGVQVSHCRQSARQSRTHERFSLSSSRLWALTLQNRTGVIQFVVILLTVLSLTSIDTFISQRQL